MTMTGWMAIADWASVVRPVTVDAVALLARATILLAGAGAVGFALRGAAAGTRHAFWSVTVAAVVALPVLGGMLPVVAVDVPGWWGSVVAVDVPRSGNPVGVDAEGRPAVSGMSASPGRSAGVAFGSESGHSGSDAGSERAQDRAAAPSGFERFDADGAESAGTASPVRPVFPLDVGAVLGLLWLAGTMVGLGALGRGLLRARGAVRRASSSSDPGWRIQAARLVRELGIRRPVALRFSAEVASPLTGGIVRPVVLLPESARAWSHERREMVLLHELVHVARGDAARHLIGRAATALYWFHPLAWWAARQAGVAREEACDEAVLARGHRPSSYARHLMELADPDRLPLPALARLERPELEIRLMAILKPRARPSRWWTTAAIAVLAAGWAATVAAVAPVAVAPGAVAPGRSAEPSSGNVVLAQGSSAEPSSGNVVLAQEPGPPPAQEATCWSSGFDRFDGTYSQRTGPDGSVAMERYGYADGDRVVLSRVGDIQLCMRTTGAVEFGGDAGSVPAIGPGGTVVLATRAAGIEQRMVLLGDGTAQWTVDGRDQPLGAEAQEWRDAVLGFIGLRWDISRIRGQVSSLRGRISSVRGRQSSLRGEISSIRGHVSSLRGEMSSVRGHVSSLRGQVSSIRGRESSLRGEISSIRGRESSLKGQISSLRGRISSLRSARDLTADAGTRDRLDGEIAGLRSEISEVEAQIDAYDTEGRVAEVQSRLDALDTDGRVADVDDEVAAYDADSRIRAIEEELDAYDADALIRAVEERLDGLDVEGDVARIEREIEALDADRRVAELEGGLDEAERRVERAVRPAR